MTSTTRRITGGVCSLVVAFAFAEILLRVADRVRPSVVFPTRSYLRFRPPPHAHDYDFRLNSRGFKDVEFSRSPTPGLPRVAVIGDSVVFGAVPYRAGFVTLAEEHLREVGRPIELLNLGVNGLDLEDLHALLVHEALPLEPELVVLCVFVGNDFRSSRRRSLWERSYLLALAHFLFGVLPEIEGDLGRAGVAYDDHRPTFSEEAHLRIAANASRIFVEQESRFEARLARAVSRIERIARRCRAAGAELWIVLVPDELQVDDGLRERVVRAAARAGDGPFELARPNRALRAALGEAGLRTIDLLQRFREAGREGRLYKPRDTHWNLAGNRLAAQTLATELAAWRSARLPSP